MAAGPLPALDEELLMTLRAENVINNMRSISFTVIDTHFVQVYAVFFAVIPSAHNMPVTGMIKVDNLFLDYCVLPVHAPTGLLPPGIPLRRFRGRWTKSPVIPLLLSASTS